MKALVGVLGSIALGVGSAGAAAPVEAKPALVMSAGSVLFVTEEAAVRLENPIRLPNGATVSPDGWLKDSRGKESHLLEGQGVSLTGEIGPVPNREEGSGEASKAVKAQ